MSLSCVITIPAGDGNGAPKAPITDEVSRFIKDSEHYQRFVLKHLKECGLCDPVEALEGHLKHRENVRMFGRVSGGLVKLAYRYRGHFGDRVPNGLAQRFLERSLDSNWPGFMFLAAKDKTVGLENVVRAVGFEEKAWRAEVVHRTKALRNAAKALAAGQDFRLQELVYPQPLYNLCYQLMRGQNRERNEANERFYDEAKAEVLRLADIDYSRDPDPEVRKAVKLTRIVRGDVEDGTILSLPSPEKEEVLLTDSGYLDDDDEEVRSLARSMVVLSVMKG